MKKLKVYIAGPITGIKGAKAIFEEVAKRLTGKGFDVVNPFNNGVDQKEAWEEHMKADIKMLVDCDAIYMLEGWEQSRGAKIERELAMQLGLTMISKTAI